MTSKTISKAIATLTVVFAVSPLLGGTAVAQPSRTTGAGQRLGICVKDVGANVQTSPWFCAEYNW